MIADRKRMAAYEQALRQAVKPGSVVLDIGTGTGICALLACRLGARRVYAIEPSAVVEAAKEIARSNSYADRIEFIQSWSTQVSLPEKADVIVSDLRDILPFFRRHIPSIADARRRLLAPGGLLIPQRDTVWAAVAEASGLHDSFVSPWSGNGHGFDMQAARRIVTNTWRKGRVTPEQLLAPPRCWATLDYASVENPNATAEIRWTAARGGTAHGLVLWFDSSLAAGVCLSNAPGATELIYGSAFFPWCEPVPIAAGDVVLCTLDASLTGEEYVWRWETRVWNRGDPKQVKAEFQQSTFFGGCISPEQLHKRAASYVPALNEEGKIDQFILQSVDSATPLGDIADQLRRRFPTRFAGRQEALTRVGELSLKYSR